MMGLVSSPVDGYFSDGVFQWNKAQQTCYYSLIRGQLKCPLARACGRPRLHVCGCPPRESLTAPDVHVSLFHLVTSPCNVQCL